VELVRLAGAQILLPWHSEWRFLLAREQLPHLFLCIRLQPG
jgi:hypothetical protein